MNRFVNLSRLRWRALLDPFAKIKDARQAWKVMYLLREVSFLVCGTIASGDDYDDIVDWGSRSVDRLAWLRQGWRVSKIFATRK